MRVSAVAYALLLFAVGGCVPFADEYGMTQEEWKHMVALQPAIIQSEIHQKQVRIGMTRQQVLLSWGRPHDINRTVTAFGTQEQWVYGLYGGPYLYFEDGKLTTVQD